MTCIRVHIIIFWYEPWQCHCAQWWPFGSIHHPDRDPQYSDPITVSRHWNNTWSHSLVKGIHCTTLKVAAAHWACWHNHFNNLWHKIKYQSYTRQSTEWPVPRMTYSCAPACSIDTAATSVVQWWLTLIVPSADAVMMRHASDESAMARRGSTHKTLPSWHRNTCNLSPV